MSALTRVYFDVENTLSVPFISGIQRVVRELSCRLLADTHSEFEFIPVVFCMHCKAWRRLSGDETEHLLTPRLNSEVSLDTHSLQRQLATRLLSKRIKLTLRQVYEKYSHPSWHTETVLPEFEPGSIFLDIDASWHNGLKRKILLPELQEKGIFIVAFHYDIIPILFPEMTHEKTFSIFLEHLQAQIQFCDLFVCISNNTEKDLQQYCREEFPAIKLNTATIKLGADISGDSIKTNTWPLPDKNLKYILCVSTIEPRKNYDFILDAFDHLSGVFPDINLVIVGREGWNSENTVSRIQQHKLLNKRLFWLTKIDDDVLASLYENAFLTVVPSLYEGYGLPVIEALQRGCVTLSSDRGALSEAGGDYVNYFNPEDLGEFIALLVSHLRSNKIMSGEGAKGDFLTPSWSNTVSQLISIIHRSIST